MNPFFQREAKLAQSGRQVLWRGQGEPSVMVPPRPLQTTPAPSSGMLKGGCGAPPQLAPPEKSGLIKAGMVSPIGGIMFAALAGLSGEAPRRGRRAPTVAVSGGLRVVWRALRGEIRNPPWALQEKSLPARGISLPLQKGFLLPKGDFKGIFPCHPLPKMV